MKRALTAIAIAATFGSVPAHAEDEEEIGILAALGLTAAEGKTEVSDKGAELEGWILASGTLAKAAKKIAQVKKGVSGVPGVADVSAKTYIKYPLLLLSGDSKFDFSAHVAAKEYIKAATEKLDSVRLLCPDDRLTAVNPSGERADSDLRLANAVIGALKVDTSIKGFDLGTPDAALINLIAGEFTTVDGDKLTSNARIPSDAVGAVDSNSPLKTSFGEMLRAKGEIEECAQDLPNSTEAEKKKKATVGAAVSNAASTEESLLAFDKDAGASLLNRALLVEPYVTGTFDALRVKVEKSGGNLITRKNIFLQFGFPGALSVSAGTIVSYRYFNPQDGSVKAAGMFVCQAAERDWHAIQAGKLKSYDCINPGEDIEPPANGRRY